MTPQPLDPVAAARQRAQEIAEREEAFRDTVSAASERPAPRPHCLAWTLQRVWLDAATYASVVGQPMPLVLFELSVEDRLEQAPPCSPQCGPVCTGRGR
jgi:hypothetical protein